MKNQKQELSLPWYRVGMVWLMIGLPTVVVIASLITVVIAYKNAPQVSVESPAHSL